MRYPEHLELISGYCVTLAFFLRFSVATFVVVVVVVVMEIIFLSLYGYYVLIFL
ncbi:hypothetical protein BDB00DRAFT_843163 [Zychaea mexicana]|uniref:uncharacterized protein n=1 Tax=Zychaea mexicana TaxID=64656 RepID=UPI0022FE467D|nr:uncharacterized protein BDB00DRAFT_843163 [Zychaea mexicana]KAI9489488.1 hypothetical protein BDB00DRAFT_843163 [Zychaea mexicana]